MSKTPNEYIEIPPATQTIELSGDYGMSGFVMRRGGYLPKVTIAYETWGTLSPNRDNAVLLFTGLSPSAHACSSTQDPKEGWWEFMLGPGKAIDTNRFYVICVNSLGSCFGSTAPSSLNPETGQPYGLSFPELTIEDIAKAAHHALNDMKIDHLHAVVGGSMGGMTVLAYALQYPDEVDHLVCVSAASRALPFTIAIRSLQREMIRCDPAWKNGDYLANEEPYCGMLLARKLGLMSYRAANEWRERFDRERVAASEHKEPFGIEFQVESYLDYNAKKFVYTFDANSYLYLSRAMDLFDVADHGGSVNAGLARIHAKSSLLIGVKSDILFPIDQQRELAEGLEKADSKVILRELDSIHGHDSFLIDADQFAPAVAEFLAET